MVKTNKRKLYRSNNDKALAGIFGGLGDYFDIDSNLLRLIGLLIFVFSGFVPFLIIYFVAMFIIPSDRESSKEEKVDDDSPGGLFIPAGVLGGMGFGFLYGNLVAGLFIGLGVGFVLFAAYEIVRKHGKN